MILSASNAGDAHARRALAIHALRRAGDAPRSTTSAHGERVGINVDGAFAFTLPRLGTRRTCGALAIEIVGSIVVRVHLPDMYV